MSNEEFKKDFCVLILTHGRAKKVVTHKTLRNQGYTGKILIVLDNEDSTIDEYKEIYKDDVVVFDKLAESKTFDTADNFNERRTIVYARNASFKIAEDKGYKYFLQLDDDYSNFNYKFNSELEYISKKVTNLDQLFKKTLEYFISTPKNVKSIAYMQGGDFIGGAAGNTAKNLIVKRKAMNTFFCSIDRPFKFLGRINEDVNTYTKQGNKGDIFFSIPLISISQKQTQSNKGGMTDVYLDGGTYLKSFYSIIFMPSSVVISLMGTSTKRLHHKINWNKTAPKILHEKYKK